VEIASAVSKIASWERKELVDRLHNAVLVNSPVADEECAALAKLLVAMLPETLRVVLTLVSQRRPPEVLFSLFCFLDQSQLLNLSPSVIAEIPRAVGAYLLEADTEAAQAPWMAGDLLGDHWSVEAALPILLKAAEEGRYAAGRAGAIHGLSHALERVGKPKQWEIVGTLKRIASNDRSQRVRAYAQGVLGELRGF
jgi:hypothetical protein